MTSLLLGLWLLLWPQLTFYHQDTPKAAEPQQIAVEVQIQPQDLTPAISLLDALRRAEAQLETQEIDSVNHELCSAVWEQHDGPPRWHFTWGWQVLTPMLCWNLNQQGFFEALVDAKGAVTLPEWPKPAAKGSPDDRTQVNHKQTVAGRITLSLDGWSVPGVAVSLISEAGEQAFVHTDEEGRFVFQPQKPGIYYLRGTLPGFITIYHRLVFDRRPMRDQDLSITVRPIIEAVAPIGKHITGCLQVGDHEPFQGVPVSLERKGKIVRTTISEADGRFCLDRLKPGTYRLRCSPAHFEEISREVAIGSKLITNLGTLEFPFVWRIPALPLCTALKPG